MQNFQSEFGIHMEGLTRITLRSKKSRKAEEESEDNPEGGEEQEQSEEGKDYHELEEPQEIDYRVPEYRYSARLPYGSPKSSSKKKESGRMKPKTATDRFFTGTFAESQKEIEKMIYDNIERKRLQKDKSQIDVYRLGEGHHLQVEADSDEGLPQRMIDSIFTNKFDGNRLKSLDDPSKHECSICCIQYIDDDDIKTLQCLHTFHKNCIDEWFQKKSTCPDCKFNLRTLNITQLV